MTTRLLAAALLGAFALVGTAQAQTASPTQSPGSQGATSPTAPNAPASQGGTQPGTGGVSQGDLVNSPPPPAAGATGAGAGTTGQSNEPGRTGTHEQDNRGVPAPTGTQGQD